MWPWAIHAISPWTLGLGAKAMGGLWVPEAATPVLAAGEAELTRSAQWKAAEGERGRGGASTLTKLQPPTTGVSR